MGQELRCGAKLDRPVLKAALAAVLVITVGAWIAYAPLGSTDQLKPDSARVVAQGSQIYAEHCASCHGEKLRGQPDWQIPHPDGRLPAPPHDASGHTWHHDDATLIKLTTEGTAAYLGDPDHPTDMHGFGDVLSDREIVAVLSYIKSTWPTEIRELHDEINARAQH